MDTTLFEKLQFKFPFRKHQKMILDKFDSIKRSQDTQLKFHIVSPPGSGKTIAGIELAIRLMGPAIVMCPNTAIQGQWMDKLNMFIPDNSDITVDDIVSCDPKELKLINVFTYQALSIPDGNDDSEISLAENMWADALSKSIGIPVEEALDRVFKMKEANPTEYSKELSKYTTKIRQTSLKQTNVDLFEILHPNARKLIQSLIDNQIETIIFDECHHLQNYWALVMAEVVRKMQIKNLIGLTATPPIADNKEKYDCYIALMGEIDFQIPTPAVVKDGLLAPYQDLVLFCTPTEAEFKFIKDCHSKLETLIAEFSVKECDFYYWIVDRVINRKLVTGEQQEWSVFLKSRPEFAVAGVKYLLKCGYKIPWEITVSESMYSELTLEDWCPLIEDYSLNLLKLSTKDTDKALYDNIREALRNLGYVLSENGIRTYSSPIDRILAYSKSKTEVLKSVLIQEMKSLGENLRVAIITDFEFSNALSLKKMENLLDEESGGAIRVIRELASDPGTNKLDPIMVTGKNLLCDRDLSEKYVRLGNEWAKKNEFQITLSVDPNPVGNFVAILGTGIDWNSRSAVLFTTSLLETGVTRCIIGTRGLLGEGWDCVNLNTLIDLSTVTTYASVNQLRGRSIRKSELDPKKLSNNWDIICIAPGLQKGYNDIERLYRKHQNFYGICDDGQIQCGINHVDGALSLGEKYLSVNEISGINTRMMAKASARLKSYALWKINEPFANETLSCCELKLTKPIKMKAPSVYKERQSTLSSKLKAGVYSTVATGVCAASAVALLPALAPSAGVIFTVSGLLGLNAFRSFSSFVKIGKKDFLGIPVLSSVSDICKVLFYSLMACNLIEKTIPDNKLSVTLRDDGTIRAYLEADEKSSSLFSTSLSEILSPIENQRYAAERYEVPLPQNKSEQLAYFIKYGMNKCPPVLMAYHPLPEVFNTKERALIFKGYWNKYVSPGEVVFLKSEKGQKIVELYGRINSFGSKKQVDNIWR